MNISYPNKFILEEMGYFSDQKGIFSRYKREKTGWDLHINNTKEYIQDFIKNTSEKNIVVLGSGWCLDIPIDSLLNNFEKIFLVDIFHPTEIIELANANSKIELILADITGGAIEFVFNSILNINRNGKANIADFKNFKFEFNVQNALILSINILNQLDVLIIDFLKNFNIYDNHELNQIRTEIQQNHIDFLIKNKTCFITDFEQIIRDNNSGVEICNSLIYCNLPKGIKNKTWVWEFDSNMKYIRNKSVKLSVLASSLI